MSFEKTLKTSAAAGHSGRYSEARISSMNLSRIALYSVSEVVLLALEELDFWMR
jgi:hypothetical protein